MDLFFIGGIWGNGLNPLFSPTSTEQSQTLLLDSLIMLWTLSQGNVNGAYG